MTGALAGFDGTVGTTASGFMSSPRMFLNTEHDYNELSGAAPTNKDTILANQKHTVYDLTKQRLYHLKPSTSRAMLVQAGPPPVFEFNSVDYDVWNSTAGLGELGHQSRYLGLQAWIEWENPPPGAATGTNSLVLDIYATYTVSMKKLQE